jgi:hypothetical protein
VATSFDVRIWSLRTEKKAKGLKYTVRWVVGPKPHTKTYTTKALAESRRSDLVTAAARGEAFDIDSGLPLSLCREENSISWYELAVMFCDMKWKRWAPGSRASAAEALATVTAALVDGRNTPQLLDLRHALEKWTFNKSARDSGEVPEQYAVAIAWLRENSVPISRLTDATVVRLALDAISTKLDG